MIKDNLQFGYLCEEIHAIVRAYGEKNKYSERVIDSVISAICETALSCEELREILDCKYYIQHLRDHQDVLEGY